MAYQVTYKTLLKDDAPMYDEWISNLDLSTMENLPGVGSKIFKYKDTVAEFRRIVGSKTAQEIVNDRLSKVQDPIIGYISSNVDGDINTSDDGSLTLVEDWSSADDYMRIHSGLKLESTTGTINLTNLSNTVTGNGTKFTTELSVNDDIRVMKNGTSSIVGTVLSIVSDTEIMLSQPTISSTMSEVGFTVHENDLYINFLRAVYNALYVESEINTTTEI